MENTKAIGYEPDGAQMINDSASSLWMRIKKSWLGKSVKRFSKFVRREGAKQPLWKVVVGFFLCWVIAWVSGFYKRGVQELLFGTIKSIWNFLLSVTVGAIIKGASENRKVK
tara:strand:- start:1 stop:336 length:336 start_codon:yes stop_codon:yes gene_type:complete